MSSDAAWEYQVVLLANKKYFYLCRTENSDYGNYKQ